MGYGIWDMDENSNHCPARDYPREEALLSVLTSRQDGDEDEDDSIIISITSINCVGENREG